MLSNIKKRFINERNKINTLTTKEKIEYIWEYHKPALIGILIFSFLLGTLINVTIIHPPKRPYLNIALYNVIITADKIQALSDQLTLIITDNPKRQEASIENYYLMGGDEISFALSMQFNRLVKSGDIDIVITNEASFHYFTQQGYFIDLETLISKKIYETVLYYDIVEKTGKNGAFGMKLSESPLFESLEIKSQNYYFAVTKKARKQSAAIKAIKVIFLTGLYS